LDGFSSTLGHEHGLESSLGGSYLHFSPLPLVVKAVLARTEMYQLVHDISTALSDIYGGNCLTILKEWRVPVCPEQNQNAFKSSFDQ
jgi:hypothetical protein